MAKIIFFNIPAHGHTNPTLWVVRELVERGHDVIYYSFSDFKQKIVATGAIYREYSSIPDISDSADLVQQYARLYYELMYAASVIMESVLKDTKKEKPDLIVHDSLAIWWSYVWSVLGIQTVSSVTTCLLSDMRMFGLSNLLQEFVSWRFSDLQYYIKANALYRRIVKTYSLKRSDLMSRFFNFWSFAIVYTSELFQPMRHLLGDVSCFFVGPSLIDRNESYGSIGYSLLIGPVVYVSFGTILNDNISFYRACIDVLSDMVWTVIISIGSNISVEDFWVVPANVIIKSYVDQLKVLQHTDVFITHGGMNSVQEWLYYGVPLVVYPLHLEQRIIAQQVEKTWCGVILRDMSIDSIKHSVLAMLSDNSYKRQTQIMQQSLRSAWWYRRAVDAIEQLLCC